MENLLRTGSMPKASWKHRKTHCFPHKLWSPSFILDKPIIHMYIYIYTQLCTYIYIHIIHSMYVYIYNYIFVHTSTQYLSIHDLSFWRDIGVPGGGHPNGRPSMWQVLAWRLRRGAVIPVVAVMFSHDFNMITLW